MTDTENVVALHPKKYPCSVCVGSGIVTEHWASARCLACNGTGTQTEAPTDLASVVASMTCPCGSVIGVPAVGCDNCRPVRLALSVVRGGR